MTPTLRSRGYLPHLEGEHPVYFVTFRLADSLPRKLVEQLQKERQILNRAETAGTQAQVDQIRQQKVRALLRKAEDFLDGGRGACYMREPAIANIVAQAILHFRGLRYELLAWCVMPNHVHVVFLPLAEYTLEAIVHSWKSFSAQAANRLLHRSGTFWQREYFDHLVRTEASLHRIVRYVLDNPRKAGLLNWPWVGGKFEPQG